MNLHQIFESLPERYNPGRVTADQVFYFSVGKEKWTVTAGVEGCQLQEGKHTDRADCVVKCDPKLFEKMVLHGKQPGPLDLARGKLKTSNPALLLRLSELFRLGA